MSFLYLFKPTPKQKLDASQLYGCQGLEFACNPINVFLLKPDPSTNSFSLIRCLLRGGVFFGRHIFVVVGWDYLLSTRFGNIKTAILKMYSLWPIPFCVFPSVFASMVKTTNWLVKVNKPKDDSLCMK